MLSLKERLFVQNKKSELCMKYYKGIPLVPLLEENIYEHWELGQSELLQTQRSQSKTAFLDLPVFN